MANVFDQFDKPIPAAKGGGNVFDRFDPAPPQEHKKEAVPAVLPEDPSERAALRMRRQVSTPRDPNSPLAQLPAATGRALESAGKTAHDLMTGELEPTPENVIPAVASTITPVARGAATAAKAATGTVMPRFTESAAGQRAAEGLAGIPYVGKPIREAADKGLAAFEERAVTAGSRSTGGIPSQTQAGKTIIQGVKDERAFVPKTGDIIEDTGNYSLTRGKASKPNTDADLSWQLRSVLKTNPENATGHLINMGGQTANADIKSLASLRANVDGESWKVVQGATFNKLGEVADATRKTVTFDAMLALENYETKLSPAGKNIIFGKPNTDYRRYLDSLVADNKRMDALRRIPERATVGGFAKVAGMAGWAMAEPVSALAAAVGARALAKIMSKPHTTAALAQWSKAYVRFFQSGGAPGGLAALKIATNNLRNTADVEIDESKLVGAMRGPKAQKALDFDSQEGIINLTTKMAPNGIPWEKMRQSENVDNRPQPNMKARPFTPAEDIAVGTEYNRTVSQIVPGRLGQEAGFNDILASKGSGGGRLDVPIPPVLPPLPRPRPKKEARR